MDLKEVLAWIKKKKVHFVNARRVAKAFRVSPKVAGHALRKLKEAGYLKIHRKRRGRFIVYKVVRRKTKAGYTSTKAKLRNLKHNITKKFR